MKALDYVNDTNLEDAEILRAQLRLLADIELPCLSAGEYSLIANSMCNIYNTLHQSLLQDSDSARFSSK